MTKKQEREQIHKEVARLYKGRICQLEMENQRLIKPYTETYKERRARTYYSSTYDRTPFLGVSLHEAFKQVCNMEVPVPKTNEDVMKSLRGIDLARYVSVLSLLSEEELLDFFKAPNEFEEEPKIKEFNISIKGNDLDMSIPINKRVTLLQNRSDVKTSVMSALIGASNYKIDAPYPIRVYTDMLVNELPNLKDSIIYVDEEYCNSPRPRDVLAKIDLDEQNLYVISVSDLKEE